MADEQKQSTERNPITVVSGENFNAYVDEKLGETPATKAAREEKEAEDAKGEDADEKGSEDVEKADKEADAKTGKKGNHKIEERFSKLTADKKAAQERADALERENAELKAKLNPPEPEDIGPEPAPEDFTDIREYQAALKEWARKDERRTLKKAQEKAAAAAAQAKLVADWKARQDSFAQEVPDYAEKIAAAGDSVKVSDQVRDAILESDAGPQILYHLADPENADFVEKLGKMTVGQALKALGRLEAKLEKEPVKPASKSGEETKPAARKTDDVEISKAPAPISTLKGANSPAGLPIDSAGNWTGTTKQYEEARRTGKIR